MNRWVEREMYGWGRHPRVRGLVARPERRAEVKAALDDRGDGPILAHGLGRSYGDAALVANGRMVLTRRLDRMLSFDPTTGWLEVEAGVSLEEIIRTFVPRGFFPPVVPGTQFVTIGGALGCDIHGKNHHVDGTFADHVRRVELLTGSGEVVVCDAEHEPDLFWATVGGMGMTGIILSLQLKLVPIDNPFIEMESVRVESLDHFFEVSAESGDFTHTVSWIDCVTTGIVIRKMISSTSITSTSGVVLMDEFMGCSASSSGAPTVMAMAAYLLPASSTLCRSPEKARTRSITVLLRRISQL